MNFDYFYKAKKHDINCRSLRYILEQAAECYMRKICPEISLKILLQNMKLVSI